MTNRIVLENARTDGVTPRSYWDVAHSSQIEGFATDMSVNAGGTIDFKINVNGRQADNLPYKIEIFRLGYYDGNGGREVAEIFNADGTVQAAALFDESRGLVDAGNWAVTDSWQVPQDAVSGVYIARIQRLDANGNDIPGATNQIPFIVRNDSVPADIVLQTSDTTWQAYNGWAGNNGKVGPSLYGDPANMVDHDPVADPGGGAQDRAYAVSYNRPFITRTGESVASGAQDYLFGADFAAIYWLEKNGYDVSYISGVDTDRQGANYLKKYDAYISVGHDEYWSGQQRANVEEARDSGVHLLFWSGNEVYWKTRWENAISADGTPYRTLVCYKETLANGTPSAGPGSYANIDPSNEWTGTWRDLRFLAAQDANGNFIAGGADPHEPENSLTGQLFGPDGTGEFGGALDVPASYGGLRVWRNTAAADGELDIASGIIGYEWNVVPEDQYRPAGLVKLSETTLNWSKILVDQGNRTEPGVATHNLTLYRDAESGALVFGTGTVFWSWGLSNEHDSSPYGANIENALLKQFTVNMFADMGIQPGSLEAGLIMATASTDRVGARATLNDLGPEATRGATLLITGTATDDDGNGATADGEVALVEISFDGGQTWRVAQGTTTWSYEWRPAALGTYDIQVRAIDDSLNVANLIVDQDTVSVVMPPRPATVSVFDDAAPLLANTFVYNDSQAVQLGMRFDVRENGTVTELKYYRAAIDAGDTDVRAGYLWRASDGALLATVTFTSNAGNAGWQTAALSTPVAVIAGVDYIVSYRTANNYVSTNDFFAPANELAFDGVDDDGFSDPFGVIRALQDTTTGINGNGVYEYGTGVVLPNNTFRSSNYWVDVTFRPDATGPNAAPSITSGNYTSFENDLTVGAVVATDPNGDPLTYAIAGGDDAALFNLNGLTGALAFLRAPNFESPGDVGADNNYDLVVSVTDGLSAPVTKAIRVTVRDLNEAPLDLTLSSAAIDENAAAGALVGTLVGVDADSGDALSYTLVNSAGGRFALSGDRIVVASGAQLDREATASYTIVVRVTDSDGLFFEKAFAIAVGDIDEFDVSSVSDADAALNVVAVGASAGTGVGIRAFAVDGDSTNSGVTYSLADDAGGLFRINAITGLVDVAEGAVFSESAGAYQIAVRATSQDGSTSTGAFSIGVTASPRVLVTLNNSNNVYVAPDGRSYEVRALGGADRVTTSTGADLINGGAGNDTIFAGGGDDIVEVTGPAAGNDAVDGGSGFDVLRATEAGTLIRLSSLSGVELVSSNGIAGVQIVGTSTADTLNFSGVALQDIAFIDMLGGNDTVIGSAGDDTILGGSGSDRIEGGGGADLLDGGTSNDTLFGGAGDDRFIFGPNAGTDVFDGGAGVDRIDVTAAGTTLRVNNAISIERIFATADNVTLGGTSGADLIDHAALNFWGFALIDGGSGNDTLIGGSDGERLAGRGGADSLTGAEGADDFVYFAVADSRTTAIDVISDFQADQDDVDVSAIDANTLLAGNQEFTFIGNSAFSQVAGQLRYDATTFPGQTRVYADVNGDGRVDMEIRLEGVLMLSSDEFIL